MKFLSSAILILSILNFLSCIPITYKNKSSYEIFGQLVNKDNGNALALTEINICITTQHKTLDARTVTTDINGFFKLPARIETEWTIAIGGPILTPARHLKIEFTGNQFKTQIIENSNQDLGVIPVELK